MSVLPATGSQDEHGVGIGLSHTFHKGSCTEMVVVAILLTIKNHRNFL